MFNFPGMHERKHRIQLILLVLSLLSISSVCAGTIDAVEGRTFVYAPSPNWEPLDYFNFRDEHTGILADLVTQMELQTGIAFKRIQLGGWSEILDSLQTGGVQITIGVHRTPSREEFLLFTDPFLTIPMVILTKRESRIRRHADLNQKTLAVVRDYASSEYLINAFPDATFMEVEDELAAMIQTAYGNADALLIDVFTAGYLMNRYEIRNLVLGPDTDFEWRLHVGVIRTEPELYALAQEFVTGLPADYDQILLRSPHHVTFSEPPGFWELYNRFIIGVFVLIMLALVLFWVLNRRLNLLVNRQVGEIEGQNAKLREIAWLQSHELRGPLCRMSTILTSLKDQEGGDAETKEILELMEKSIDEIDLVIHTIVRKTNRLDLD
jgi:ABC-type amino acid transport substrate-binding protein